MNVKDRLLLSGRNLLGSLSRDDGYLPYWHMAVDGDLRAMYQFRPYCTGHNVGRWWNAMLRLERAAGFEIPVEIEAAMLENSRRLSDNASGIFLEDVDPCDPATWYIHSYRETMLSFGLLVECRGSNRAAAWGRRAIEGMSRASRDLMEWKFSFDGGPVRSKHGNSAAPAYTHGRAIEGLLCFHAATGEPAAFKEAERLADFHFRFLLNQDGSLAGGCGHHTHSYLNTLRGLLKLAVLQGSRERQELIYKTYREAVSGMITRSGFVTHDIGDHYGGDIASAGDIAHIALLLWDLFADPGLLDDAERIARARLFPAQVREPVPIRPAEVAGARDCYRDLPIRFVGAIGGSVGHVSGQTCVTDFTASALHSLIELWTRTVDVEGEVVRVNFHFDYDLPELSVRAERGENGARVTVVNRTGKELRLRYPGWADEGTCSVTVDGRPVEATVQNGFVVVAQGEGASTSELRFALPEYEEDELSRDASAEEDTVVAFRWRGDEIADVSSGGPYMEPHPALCRSLL
ncbi:MAG: hypothetical protein OYM47_05390 [Gemmatimonadota bacterium]|nr:hypothetical protein [Gemmatimonadota bacterium]